MRSNDTSSSTGGLTADWGTLRPCQGAETLIEAIAKGIDLPQWFLGLLFKIKIKIVSLRPFEHYNLRHLHFWKILIPRIICGLKMERTDHAE